MERHGWIIVVILWVEKTKLGLWFDHEVIEEADKSYPAPLEHQQ